MTYVIFIKKIEKNWGHILIINYSKWGCNRICWTLKYQREV